MYRRPPRMNSRIEPFHKIIAQTLLKRLIETRISKELKNLGYEGCGSALYSYLEVRKFMTSPLIENLKYLFK